MKYVAVIYQPEWGGILKRVERRGTYEYLRQLARGHAAHGAHVEVRELGTYTLVYDVVGNSEHERNAQGQLEPVGGTA